MKLKKGLIMLSTLFLVILVGCSNIEKELSEIEVVTEDENTQKENPVEGQTVSGLEIDFEALGIEVYVYPEEFTLSSNLKSAIEELALSYSTFDSSRTKEELYPQFFLSHYCQNSRFGFDYLEKIDKEKNGLLSKEEVEYIQYSLTNEFVDFENYVGEEGIDLDQTTSGLGLGKIISYEANQNKDEVNLTAQFEFRGSNFEQTSPYRLYELNIVLIKNPKSCFDGYSIKSLMKKEITPVITGDGKTHTFQGLDIGIENEGIFTFEYYGSEDGVIYGTHIEVDLSESPILADFVRENAGKEFEVTYVLEDTMVQPVEQIVPIDIRLN